MKKYEPDLSWKSTIRLVQRDDEEDVELDVDDLLHDLDVAVLGLAMCWFWQKKRKLIAIAHIHLTVFRILEYLELYQEDDTIFGYRNELNDAVEDVMKAIENERL